MSGKTLKRNAWMLLVIIAFSLVFLNTLNLVYLDGDDASSIAYHLFGRDDAIQEPYKAYHGMMDRMLSVLPSSNESLVRSVAFLSTALATIVMLLLVIALIFDWRPAIAADWRARWVVVGMLLVVSPEFYYWGLVYSPTMIAMCCVLGAHLLLRHTLRRSGNGALVVLSLILFGFGIAIRWSVLGYGLVIVADIAGTMYQDRSLRARGMRAAQWGIGALVSSFLFILISGYGPQALVDNLDVASTVSQQSGSVSNPTALIDQETIATLFPLVTPAFGVFGLVGFLLLLRERNPLVLVVVAGIIGVLPWIFTGVPKFIISSIPGMVLCVVIGFAALWNWGLRGQGVRWAWRAALIVLLLGPWFVGVSVTQADSAWGPGFELRPYDRDDADAEQFGITLGVGTAFPTPEHRRALGGHAFVFFDGEWKHAIREEEQERERLIELALDQQVPILALAWSPDYFAVELISRGFSTADPQERPLPEYESYVERRFTHPEGQQVIVLYKEVIGEFDSDELIELASLRTIHEKVSIFGYSSSMRSLYETAPQALQKLGPRTAVLELPVLAQAVTEQDVAAGSSGD